MGKVDVKFIMALGTAIVSAMVFFYTTFATVQYVDTKHQGVLEKLQDIKDRLVRIEDKQDKVLRRK